MPTVRPIHTEADFEQVLQHSAEKPVVIFKHSIACPISAWAKRNVEELTAPGDPPVYEVVVQHARPLSNLIATRFGIRHESPQVIVLHEGHPIYDASHYHVRPDAIRAVLPKTFS